jgi:hypothetical protein
VAAEAVVVAAEVVAAEVVEVMEATVAAITERTYAVSP